VTAAARTVLRVALATAAVAAPLFVGGCGGGGIDPTSVVVRVTSDLVPGTDFNQVEIVVSTTRGMDKPATFPVNQPSDMPASLAIVPLHDRGETFDVEATAQIVDGSGNLVSDVVSTSVQITFMPGQSALVWLELSRACIPMTCGDNNQTCEDGRCGDRKRDPSPYDRTSGVPDLRVQYLAQDASANTKQIQPYFNIINSGDGPVPLEELSLRYWYSSDGLIGSPVGTCDYAKSVAQDHVSLGFNTAAGPREGLTDSYFEIRFMPGAGNIIAKVGAVQLQTRFYGPDFNMTFTQTNDYSFDGTKTAFADWSRVTLYRSGRLIWGTEPRPN